MIIAVDYDGTLYNDGQVNVALIQSLRQDQQRGQIVILWTCRAGDRLLEAVQKLQQYGFKPNLINQNAPQVIKMLGHDPRKIFADVYIDDKAVKV